MSTLSSTEINKNNNKPHDNTCHRFGCSNRPSEKINVSAGTFGIITLKLCNKCVDLFKNSNTSSQNQSALQK
jgi:hypothetical protein